MVEWPRTLSVFARLVAIMLTMAAGLLLLVTLFFWFAVGPDIHTSIHRLRADYSEAVVATSPDLEAARRLGARLNLDMRYQGPDGSWSTADDLPAIDDIRQGRVGGWRRFFDRRSYRVVPGPQGGTYLFVWSFGGSWYEAHLAALILLLALIVGVVLTAHASLRRLLRPLRDLSEGVARLGAGQLDVALPRRTRDEFGRLTDAFNEMVGRVREMIRARDQLLLDVSHELRSPLTRMRVALELLPEGEQRTRVAADIAEMEQMIAELLELERLRDGRSIRPVRQDLSPILRDVAEDFEDRAPGVRVESPSREVLANVDGEKLRMVLRNLLENAAKYALPDSRPVELSVVEGRDTIVIRVTDDGPGIPEADVDRVFEPFFRVDRSRSKSTGGYGLGLSICKRVMEAHGGSIAVRSGPRRGTSFELTFPASG